MGAGYTKGADNSKGDWSEDMLTTHAAPTREDVMFRNGTGYVLTAVASTALEIPHTRRGDARAAVQRQSRIAENVRLAVASVHSATTDCPTRCTVW